MNVSLEQFDEFVNFLNFIQETFNANIVSSNFNVLNTLNTNTKLGRNFILPKLLAIYIDGIT